MCIFTRYFICFSLFVLFCFNLIYWDSKVETKTNKNERNLILSIFNCNVKIADKKPKRFHGESLVLLLVSYVELDTSQAIASCTTAPRCLGSQKQTACHLASTKTKLFTKNSIFWLFLIDERKCFWHFKMITYVEWMHGRVVSERLLACQKRSSSISWIAKTRLNALFCRRLLILIIIRADWTRAAFLKTTTRGRESWLSNHESLISVKVPLETSVFWKGHREFLITEQEHKTEINLRTSLIVVT